MFKYKEYMGLLDNIDIQLDRIQNVSNSLKSFKQTKLKNLKVIKDTPKKYFKDSSIKINKKNNKKQRKDSQRKERNRCPKQYKLYIKSRFWEERKNKYYQSHPRICSACGSSKYIDLHHIVYGNFGSELDEHLTPLCKECHNEFHTNYGTKRNMVTNTNSFIINKREQIDFPILK